MNTALVIPTIRERSIKEFFKKWIFNDRHNVILVEDNPNKSFEIKTEAHLTHVSWKEIDEDLKDKAWIIPRKTDCIRSYGFYLAYKENYDAILTLDDDCYPEYFLYSNFDQFLKLHIANLNFQPTKWVSTIKEIKPRGLPFKNKGERKVVINMGFWKKIPDLDAPTHLSFDPEREYEANFLMPVPPNYYYPMSGMNLMFIREDSPMMYFLLMGRDYKYDRFGDIWCGIISKKICDHLGLSVTAGSPDVIHDKASNIWANLRKETEALHENEFFWEEIDEMKLMGNSVIDCYKEISNQLPDTEYYKKLKEAMDIWVTILS